MPETTSITVETLVRVPVAKAWHYWTTPEHIMKWNSASEDWHTPNATNDLREGGRFIFRMEAKDGSMGFDFGGTYTKILVQQQIQYTLGDSRKVCIIFEEHDGQTHITETFDPESQNSREMQRQGWQAILSNFTAYAEKQ